MSQRTENQVAEMKKQTIGVEVEMNSITREGRKAGSHLLRYRAVREHRLPQRLLHLVGLG